MSQQLIGLGTSANDGTGDTPRAAGAKMNLNFAELYQTRPSRLPHKVSIHGDSVSNMMGNLTVSSPLYWAMTKTLRNMEILRDLRLANNDAGVGSDEVGGIFGVNSSISGPIYTGLGRTGSVVAAGTNINMNDAARLARITAYASDIMFFEIGTNEVSYTTAALDATILNTKDVIAANPNPNKQIVFFSMLPRQTVSQTDHLRTFDAWCRHMATTYPGYHFIDWSSIALDQTSGTYAWLAAFDEDTTGHTHPGPKVCRAAVSMVDGVLDRLGVARINPRVNSPTNIWSASNPAGNVLGTKGQYPGSVAPSGAPAQVTGLFSTGITHSGSALTGATNLAVVGAKDTIVDANGSTFPAQKVTFSSSDGNVLASNANYAFSITAPTAPTGISGRKSRVQTRVQHQNLVGCGGIALFLYGGVSVNFLCAQMGGPAFGAVPTLGTPEQLIYNVPPVIFDPANASPPKLFFQVTFNAGALPSGSIWFADSVCAFDLANTYD